VEAPRHRGQERHAMIDAVIFAAGLATMYAAHQVADHVFGQTDKMAANKANPGISGWSHITMHVLQYHLVMIAMLFLTFSALDMPVTLTGFSLAILFSAATHAVLDRRWPVKWILEKTGSPEFAKMQQPLCGMYLADQGLHWFCLWISALLLTI
jgi:hypothetical protein